MFTLNCKGRLLKLDKPVVMGIINVTPDSFYSGSRYENVDTVLHQAELMLKEGASILDIGGQSTRPGSIRLSAKEELNRIIKPIEAIHKNFPTSFISVDTYQTEVAREAINAGACMINDISAGLMDPDIIKMVATLNVPYILMHMQGTPDNMQTNPVYKNVTQEVIDFLTLKIHEIRKAGIKDIIIDPGFGFGKAIAHNFELLHNLSSFKILDCPILLGISRKSTIYKTLGISAENALNGTTVLNTIGLLNGASILRVHDVKEAIEAIRLYINYNEAGK